MVLCFCTDCWRYPHADCKEKYPASSRTCEINAAELDTITWVLQDRGWAVGVFRSCQVGSGDLEARVLELLARALP
jgi:hypothetical protein